MTFAAIYALIVGAGMIGQWSLSLARNHVPELKTEPIRIRFHIVTEFITAAALLAGGSALLLDIGWGLEVYLVSMGMLLYTVMVSPGYFAQKRQWRTAAFFAVLLVLAVVSIALAV